MKNGVPARNQSFHEENGATIFYGVALLLAMFFWKVVLWVVIGVVAFILVAHGVEIFIEDQKRIKREINEHNSRN